MNNLILTQLSTDEKLFWQGKPNKLGFLLLGPWWLFVPLSVLWCIIAIAWEYTAYSAGAPLLFIGVGALFVCIGLYLAVGRWFFASKECDNTYYALTDKRAIIQQGLLRPEFQNIDLTRLGDVSLHMGSSGKGDIIFGSRGLFAFYIPGWPMMRGFYAVTPAFYAVEGASSLYEKINTLRRAGSNKV